MLQTNLIQEMAAYFHGDPKRIQHLLKVYAFAKVIGESEGLDEALQRTLEIAAIVHDIGIRASERKYGHSTGKLQEQEGPAVARPMLERAGIGPEEVDRICFLVAHHHTYTGIDGMDYQILIEADFLVNAYEHSLSAEQIRKARRKLFRTASGTALLDDLFDL